MQCIFLNPEAGDTARYSSIKTGTVGSQSWQTVGAPAALAEDLRSVLAPSCYVHFPTTGK